MSPGTARTWALAALAALAGAGAAHAQEPVRLQESFAAGYRYSVKVRADLAGALTVPPAKDSPARTIKINGGATIDYDERVLAVSGGEVTRTLRICRRTEVRRTVADQKQQSVLRPAVKRLVIVRHKHTEVPFSPDGPLTWGEMDLMRTDVFTPALVGLFPDRAVRVGEKWPASVGAVRELTDMEQIDKGGLECKLESVDTVGGRREARVTFGGTVSGVSEDGASRQALEGHFTFDLDGRYLRTLSLRGTHSLLGMDGKEVGTTEGRFLLQRQANTRPAELADEALRGVTLEPNAENTRLLYDNPDLGARFVYPRRWRVGAVRGRQVTLDGDDGSGLLLTLDPVERLPTAAAFLAESRAYLEKQKAKITRVGTPIRVGTGVEQFALEAEMGGQKVWMDYYIVKQAPGGATLAARLPARDLDALRREALVVARSVVVTRRIAERK